MEDVRLPDLNKLRSVKKRMKDLPPQKSATDTSNWENRTDTAPYIDKVTKKRSVRHLDYIKETPMSEWGISPEEAEKILEQQRTKKASK